MREDVSYNIKEVALRKESVDRNGMKIDGVSYNVVALRKESVDRNAVGLFPALQKGQSLSARRAWIEIAEVSGSNQAIISRSPQGERG